MESETHSHPEEAPTPNPLRVLKEAKDGAGETLLWSSLASFEGWKNTNTTRVRLPGLGYGPNDGPPPTAAMEAVAVRAMLSLVYDFSTFPAPQTAASSARTIKSICESQHLSPTAKIHKIMGPKIKMPSEEIEFHMWKLLSITVDVHRNGYKVEAWQSSPEPEEYPSFSVRWATMAQKVQTQKSIVKSIVVDEGFALRFVLRPDAEAKAKLANETVNAKKADTIRIGRTVQSQTGVNASAAPGAPGAPAAAGAPPATSAASSPISAATTASINGHDIHSSD